MGAPAWPEAWNVTEPPTPAAVADTVLLLLPATSPSFQLVAVAIPAALVITVMGLAGVTVPPEAPRMTVKVTAMLGTGLLCASVTNTEGGAATSVATSAD